MILIQLYYCYYELQLNEINKLQSRILTFTMAFILTLYLGKPR